MKRVADDAGQARFVDEVAVLTPSIPIPPPAELLKLAKKLGAINAGPAMFGRAPETVATPRDTKRSRSKGRPAKATGKRKKSKR